MRIRTVLNVAAIVAVGLLPGAARVQAHHAFSAEFDADRPIKVTGTITMVEWVNPHSWFHLDVKTPDGKVEKWMFEGGGPGALTRRGFTKDFLKPGTELVIEGFMAKGVPRRANARLMTYPDGRKLFVGSSGTGAPADGRDPDER